MTQVNFENPDNKSQIDEALDSESGTEADRKRIKNLETCLQLTSLITSELDLDTLLETIMKTAKEVMNADACSLLLFDKDKRNLEFRVALSVVGEKVKNLGRIHLGEGIAGTVAKTGLAMVIEDAYSHPNFNPNVDKATGFQTGSILCAPLIYKNRILGVCEVIHERTGGKVFSQDCIPLFKMICDSSSLAIENALSVKKMVETQKLDQEMRMAHAVQQEFLPVVPNIFGPFEFAAKMIPARVVGGDFFDFIPINSEQIAILIGDVAGKGMPAALHMARLMSDFRHVVYQNPDPRSVLESVNQILCERSKEGSYTTAIFLLLDINEGILKIANAGHPGLILQSAGENTFFEAHSGGTPLGIVPNTVYMQEEIVLKRGDRVFLHTDGVLETKNESNNQFGLDKLCDILKNEPSGPRALILRLERELSEFIGDASQFDDWTFLSFKAL